MLQLPISCVTGLFQFCYSICRFMVFPSAGFPFVSMEMQIPLTVVIPLQLLTNNCVISIATTNNANPMLKVVLPYNLNIYEKYGPSVSSYNTLLFFDISIGFIFLGVEHIAPPCCIL